MSRPTAERLGDEVLGEEVFRYHLPCGMPVVVQPKPGYLKKFAILGANFGSVDTAFRDRRTGRAVRMPEGIAHFLEHKLFELDGEDAFDEFGRQAASANAATSFRTTTFFFGCSTRLNANLGTLLRMLREPGFTAASIEKEKEIVVQEIRMYEDSPDWQGLNRLVKGLFHRHPVRSDIIGTEKSVLSINHRSLLRCYENFYAPGNLCLVVTGDVDPDEIAGLAAREMAGAPSRGAPHRLAAREPRGTVRTRVSTVLDVQRPKLLVGFKERVVPVAGEDLRRRDLLTGILLALMFGSSSATWLRLYEQGVLDDSFYTSYVGDEDFGFLTLACETDDVETTRRTLFRAIRDFGKRPIDTEDFGRVVHKMLGRFVRGLDSQEGTAFMLLGATFKGLFPFRTPVLLRQITPDEVRARHAELFGTRNHCTSVVLPRS